MKHYLVMGDTDLDIFLTVPKIPTWDEGILATKSEFLPGGKAANTAVQLFSFGSSVSLFSCIGDDLFGMKSIERIKKLHMDERFIFVEKGEATTYCVMMLDETGEKALVVSASNHIYPPIEKITENEKIFREYNHLHLIGLQPDKVLHCIPFVKKYHLQLSIDLDSASRGLEATKELIEASDILFLNKQGAINLFPGKDVKEALQLLYAMGPSEIICTLGSAGILSYDGKDFSEVPGYAIHPVDTTGSGDACIAAYLHGRFHEGLAGKDLLEFANGAGALMATRKGGQSIFLNRELVEAFIKTENKDAIIIRDGKIREEDNVRHIYFYEPFDDFGYFCNLSEHEVFFDGLSWPTAEHCYQAQKHTDTDYRERIRMAQTCQEAISLGRDETRKSFRGEEWLAARVKVMKDVVLAKFSQHNDLKELLLATGNAYLAEHTENDCFWGDGFDGTGKNWLGKILMEVREQLKSNS